jgi:hypothetical protein
MTAIAANSSSNNYWEGCYRLYTPHSQPFPGTVLSTGMEDFFDSAYGFETGVVGLEQPAISKHIDMHVVQYII